MEKIIQNSLKELEFGLSSLDTEKCDQFVEMVIENNGYKVGLERDEWVMPCALSL